LVFDVTDADGNYYQFKNNFSSFKKFVKLLNCCSHCVMEATGYYHYALSQFLCKNKVAVLVVNSLSVKRFIQMKLSRIKTDKSDAQVICEYGIYIQVSLYNGINALKAECKQLLSLKANYVKRRTSTKNKLHGEEVLGKPSKLVIRSLNND
jgi:transposase